MCFTGMGRCYCPSCDPWHDLALQWPRPEGEAWQHSNRKGKSSGNPQLSGTPRHRRYAGPDTWWWSRGAFYTGWQTEQGRISSIDCRPPVPEAAQASRKGEGCPGWPWEGGNSGPKAFALGRGPVLAGIFL